MINVSLSWWSWSVVKSVLSRILTERKIVVYVGIGKDPDRCGSGSNQLESH